MTKKLFLALAILIGVAGCTSTADVDVPTLSTAEIVKIMPNRGQNKSSWANDISSIMDTLNIPKSASNVCSVMAIIDQESNFQADPTVPNLGKTSLNEINTRLDDKLGKPLADIFRLILKEKPDPKNNFLTQIQTVKTEQQLDKIYQSMFDYFTKTYKVSSVNRLTQLTGETIEERMNPITTLGSMQVHIDYARDNRRTSMDDRTLRADLYGQYGGLYYGIHRLMTYQANYDKPIYRFADYNSGIYSSRNAAFQQRIATLSGQTLAIDGDLLLYKNGKPIHAPSQTEQALIKLLATVSTPLSANQIRHDLKKEKRQAFEDTKTYQTVNELFTKKTGKPPSYAIIPNVTISGPKISHSLNTNWYATRVDKRYQTCIQNAKKHGIKLT